MDQPAQQRARRRLSAHTRPPTAEQDVPATLAAIVFDQAGLTRRVKCYETRGAVDSDWRVCKEIPPPQDRAHFIQHAIDATLAQPDRKFLHFRSEERCPIV